MFFLNKNKKKRAQKAAQANMTPTIIPRSEHPVSRQHIAENALKVLYRLHQGGYDAYLVGGCVRDLILGIQPKDFDVATNATPEQVKELFRNCRLIGRRFRLAHIVFGRDVIEVATFRGTEKDQTPDHLRQQSAEGMLLRDNVWGSIEEDAARRDFTVNALYYSIADFAIYDFANGVADLEAGRLRLIGDPAERYREDPVRMLRAVRFATKLGLSIDNAAEAPIAEQAALLGKIPPARLFEEFLKLFLHTKAEANFVELLSRGLFQQLFPQLKAALKNTNSMEYQLVRQAFADTDQRLLQDKGVNPAFLFAALLWYPMQSRADEIMQESGLPRFDSWQMAAADVVNIQSRSIAIPKRFSLPMRDIWTLQIRLERTRSKRALRLLGHPKFRAAYDFLLLRGKVEQNAELIELGEFWTRQQEENPSAAAPPTKKNKRRPRKARGGRPAKK